MLEMPDRIKIGGSAIGIVRSQLETVEITARKYDLVSIEMLVVLYRNLGVVQETTHTEPVFQKTTQFQVQVVPNLKFPFIELYVTSQ